MNRLETAISNAEIKTRINNSPTVNVITRCVFTANRNDVIHFDDSLSKSILTGKRLEVFNRRRERNDQPALDFPKISTPVKNILYQMGVVMKNNLRDEPEAEDVYFITAVIKTNSEDDTSPYFTASPGVEILSTLHNLPRMISIHSETLIDKIVDMLESGYENQKDLSRILKIVQHRFPSARDYGKAYEIYKCLPKSFTNNVYIPENNDKNCFLLCLEHANYPFPENFDKTKPIRNIKELFASNLKNIRILKIVRRPGVENNTKLSMFAYDIIHETEVDCDIKDKENKITFYNIVIQKPEDVRILTERNYIPKDKSKYIKLEGHCGYVAKTRHCNNCFARRKCQVDCVKKRMEEFKLRDEIELNFDERQMTCKKTLPAKKSFMRFVVIFDTETDTTSELLDTDNAISIHKLVVGNMQLLDLGKPFADPDNLSNCNVIESKTFYNNTEFTQTLEEWHSFVVKEYNRYNTLTQAMINRVKYYKVNDIPVCYLCEQQFNENSENEEDRKIIHHDHSGNDENIWYAHHSCNLIEGKSGRYQPIVAHNINYDYLASLDEDGQTLFNAIVTNLCSKDGKFSEQPSIIASSFSKIKSLTLIPKGENNFKKSKKTSVTTIKVKFLDWFAFLSTSLDNISKDNMNNFPLLKNYFKNETEDFYEMAKKKALFPYDILTLENYKEKNEIPPREAFKNSLINQELSEKDYEKVLQTYKVLNESNFRKQNNYPENSFKMYTDFYLQLDNLCQGQSVASLCKNVFYFDHLNVLSHVGSPSFALSYVLRKYEQPTRDEKTDEIKCETLENIHDEEQYRFIRSGLVGGLSKTFAKKAENDSRNHIFYMDFNSLYPTCLSLFPNCSKIIGFDNEITLEEIINTADDSQYGYLVSVDFKINRDHEFNGPEDFQPVSERVEVTEDMVDPIQYKYLKKTNTKLANERLTQTYFDKEDYVLNYIYLKYLISMNLITDVVLKKALKFKQNFKHAEIMEGLRKQRVEYRKAGNKSMADTQKLISNSYYGKTLQNQENLSNKFSIIANSTQLNRVRHPMFHDYHILNNDKSFIQMKNKSFDISTNNLLGVNILSFAKQKILQGVHMFKQFCLDRGYTFKMQYTDTDSIIFSIQSPEDKSYEELYDEMYADKKLNPILDFNGVHEKFKDSARDKKYGLMSSECGYTKDENIKRAYFISSKCYAYELHNGKVCLKGKGVASGLLKKEITIDDYADCIYNYDYETKLNFKEFVKTNLVIQTREGSKIALTNSDIKSKAVRNKDGSITLINIGY